MTGYSVLINQVLSACMIDCGECWLAHLIPPRNIHWGPDAPVTGGGIEEAGLVVAVAACDHDAAVRQRRNADAHKMDNAPHVVTVRAAVTGNSKGTNNSRSVTVLNTAMDGFIQVKRWVSGMARAAPHRSNS